MFTVPTILKLLVEHESAGRFDHSSLRYVIYAGAPMYREDQKRALAVLGPVLVQYFGLGEVTGAITVLPTRLHAAEDGPEVRLGTCGFDRTGMQLQVQGEDGRALGALRDRGDLRHRPGGLRRLLRQPRGQREGLPRRLVPHRRPRAHRRAGLPLHHRPGVGHVHLRRLQRLSARDRGEDPDPPRCHGGRRRRRARPALGRGRHRRLRRHRAQVSEAELAAFLDGKLSRYKLPKRFVFWEALPKSAYGKITKKLVRAELDRLGLGAPERESA